MGKKMGYGLLGIRMGRNIRNKLGKTGNMKEYGLGGMKMGKSGKKKIIRMG